MIRHRAWPVRPAWVPERPVPVRGSLGGHRRQSRPLRRRGSRSAAPAAERQSQLVVRLARRHPWSAWVVPMHRARLSGVRAVARRPPASTTRRAHSRRWSRRLVDRLGLDGMVVFGYAWGGPIGLGLAGRRPELVRALVIANTWAWPDDRLRVRLFSALMGGPLSPLLVDRLNLMLRVYLPFNLKRGPPDRRGAGRLCGTVPARKAIDHGRLPARDRPRPRATCARSRRTCRRSPPSRPSSSGRTPTRVRRRRAGALAGAVPGGAGRSILPRTGQFIDEDAPDDVVAAIAGMVGRDAGPRSGVGRGPASLDWHHVQEDMEARHEDGQAAVADIGRPGDEVARGTGRWSRATRRH